jgi:hypothetical protein
MEDATTAAVQGESAPNALEEEDSTAVDEEEAAVEEDATAIEEEEAATVEDADAEEEEVVGCGQLLRTGNLFARPASSVEYLAFLAM